MAGGVDGKQPTNLARLFPDHPADRGALKFEFEGLAKTLAELALNPDNATPFAVVVRGGWGRGKTTLLKRAQRLLKDPSLMGLGSTERRVETLWFNAWKYPDEDTVLAGLLGELLDKLKQGDVLSQLKKVIFERRGAAGVAVLKAAAPGPLKAIFEAGSKTEEVEDKRAFYDTFRDLFSQVSYVLFKSVAVLRDTGGRSEEALWDTAMQREATLAIFLDDLDRCSRERVVEVLRVINLFLDLPGVCFYLGIDRQRLLDRLPEAVGAQGEEFLEKIVQVAFDLPEVSEQDAKTYIQELLAGTPLADVMRAGKGDEPGDVAVLAGSLKPRHPRHVKRFLNDLSVGMAVLRNTEKLGDESPRVPEAAVLAWHLLSEILPDERWHAVRALPANMQVFLREWDALDEGEAGEGDEGAEKLSQLRQSGLLERHMRALRDLDDDQIRSLHLASPAEERPRRRRPTGRVDLFDLESDTWVELPAGEFDMGSKDGQPRELPVHRVALSEFRISRHPVTNAEYREYVTKTGKRTPDHWEDREIPEGKENHPVVNVSWKDAEAFCTWLSEKVGGDNVGGAFQLPTEAQWEYAARGQEGRIYPWGADEPTEERANFGANVGDTTPVGAYRKGATPEGIQDLAGNVWEWCRDWYDEYSEDRQVDPAGPSSGSSRVLRGGAWLNPSFPLRGAFRYDFHPDSRYDYFGFRVVWSSS